MGVTGVAIDQDVLVIGGGLAGATAALGAAETGATTRLVSHKQSTLRQASGLIDVLGYTPGGDGPVVDPFETIPELPETHPYRRAGIDALEAGLGVFERVTGDAYRGSHTDKNALVPTHGGSIKPTARYPAGTAQSLASDDRDMLLVGFEQLPTFDAPLAAKQLGETGLPASVRGVTLDFPVPVAPDADVTRFARILDQNTAPDGPENVRRALAERIGAHLEGEHRVGFPAVLGLAEHEAVRGELEGILALDVFEVPMGPPSLPGIRLEELLFDALDESGVRIETGNPVVAYEGNNFIEHVFVDRNGSEIPYAASEFVLATGGLVGQGIDSDREGVREPIFDCHVAHPDDRYEWFAGDAFGDHEFAQFGVAIDEPMRPTAESGEAEFANLRAAGAVLGNYDYAEEKSASGVSLATGYRAGTLAGEHA
jgi:glycerol-3-phosphate dehydrogenase subunit B